MGFELADGQRYVVFEGDCLSILPTLDLADHIITDPPYDAKTHGNARTMKDGGGSIDINFAPLLVGAYLPLMLGAATRWLIAFCALEMLGTYAAKAGDRWVRAGIWDRPDGTPQLTGDRPGQAAEGIAIMHGPGKKVWNRSGKRGMWRCGVERDERLHPTPKPVSLMMELIEDFTSPNEIILDPFAGSGATGLAALRLGRRAILIERKPEYAAICRERCAAEVEGSTLQARRAKQEPLFK